MSYHRLGALAAGLCGLGWLLAISINLLFWLPQVRGMAPDFYDDGAAFLRFVADNRVSWQVFHIGTSMGLGGLLLLIPLLDQDRGHDPRHGALTTLGVVGAVMALLASLIDQLGTPVMARLAAGGSQVAIQVWQFVEPWRDGGLKTVSFWTLGLWAVWIAGDWLHEARPGLGRLTRLLGGGLLLLAAVETLAPQQWKNQWGETGPLGLVLVLLPLWGLAVARRFWLQELGRRPGGPG